ncbi:MAG: DNA polymerase III subunit alpha [Patescibacteria group bacterium]|nr:DNA polymerase III subunit alpha [Patescibacteria group bacterium]MDE2438063.1 DNA polymerase III subunit alpha [Patescibacteria group bacterium]
MKFTHLHVHSHYSLLDGLPKIPELIKKAASLGMDSLALTDHGNLHGAIEFYNAAKKEGIKPIIGLEAYIAQGSMYDKNPGIDDKRYHLTLLATSYEGYKNLIKLSTKAHLEGFYYKPRMDKALLKQHAKGIIALSGCLGGELAKTILQHRLKDAEQLIYDYEDIFGKGNFYLELGCHTNHPEQREVNETLFMLSQKTGAKTVATGDIHYLNPEDREAQDILVSVQTGSQLNDANRFSMKDFELSMKSGEEMAALFPNHPEAIANTQEIANKTHIELELDAWTFPNFVIPEGTTYDGELRRLVYEGIPKRNLEHTPEITERIEYELNVINTKGYSPYFLVVSDLLEHARNVGILTTTRGSAAGSLVSYLTGITAVNPLTYELPFERFLNPERPSAPDIDMDLADDKRDKLIDYAREKYGIDHVAQIGTFGTMMARAAVRDVARALGYPYALGDKIAKNIPMGSQGFPMTIDYALEISPELLDIYQKEDDAKRVIDQAKKLEGCVRHVSVHAAGVVISAQPLTEYVPLQLDPKGGKIITQYDMHAVESAGLLKFDFLGIRNLAILGDAIQLVKRYRNIDIDIQTIPFDDRDTFALLARGETIGLFQLNGDGMTKWLKELRPTRVHDINVMVALYRPGPMDNISNYVARKNGHEQIVYLHPKMESFLAQTFGVLVYQDDLLMTAIELAGYSWGEVDKFRKAVGKKIPEEMAKQHVKFVEGCIAHSEMSREKAEEIWALFEPFQGYGFNKAHAASYGQVAYQTAYMKTHFPGEYMTAILTAESGDNEKVAEIIAECVRMQIPVLPPNINESVGQFALIKNGNGAHDSIRFGLSAVKNVGSNIIEAIVQEREAHGRFANVENFLQRVNHKDLNKKSLESLIKVGAFDGFRPRHILLASLENLIFYASEIRKEQASPQNSLFADSYTPTLKFTTADPIPKQVQLAYEKELLGLYVSGHPLDIHKERLAKSNFTTLRDLTTLTEGTSAKTAGIISSVKKIMTKKGDMMLFVAMEDHTGTQELIVFPKLLAKTKDVWQKDQCIIVLANIDRRNGDLKLLCEDAKLLT